MSRSVVSSRQMRLIGEVLPVLAPCSSPDLRVSAVELHAVRRGHEIRIAYGKTKALHVLLPVAVPDYHVGNDGVDTAAHRVGFPAVTKVMHRWTRVKIEGLDRSPPCPRQRILVRRVSFLVEEHNLALERRLLS